MSDWTGFIRKHTAVLAPPLVPEIRLHLASEVTPLWQATETLLERTGLPPPYWAFAWPGGQALARYVLDHAEIASGRAVLDFAAGSALAGIAAARAGAARVTAAEIDPAADAAIQLNAALNGVSIELCADDLTESPAPVADLILAGDVCYERAMADRVTRWLSLQASLGATVLLANPGRAYRPIQGLSELARYCVPTLRDLEDSDERETVIWTMSIV